MSSSRGTNSRPIKCSVCENTFVHWEQFFRHVNGSHPDSHVACAWCGLYFVGNTLKRHMMHTHADPNKKARPKKTTTQTRTHHGSRQPPSRPPQVTAPPKAPVQLAAGQPLAVATQPPPPRTYPKAASRQTPSGPPPSSGNPFICEHCARFHSTSVVEMQKHCREEHGKEFRHGGVHGQQQHQPTTSAPVVVPSSNPATLATAPSTQAPARRPPAASNDSSSEAAAALLSMASSKPRIEDAYIATCVNCKTLNRVDQNASWVVCYACSEKFACEVSNILSAAEAKQLKQQQNMSDSLQKIAPNGRVKVDQVLNEQETVELNEWEAGLANKDERYLRQFLVQMVNQAIRNRRSAEDLDEKLVDAEGNIRILETRLSGMQNELGKVKNERDQYKSMALRLHEKNQHKRPLENGDSEAPPAKRQKLNDSTHLPVKAEVQPKQDMNPAPKTDESGEQKAVDPTDAPNVGEDVKMSEPPPPETETGSKEVDVEMETVGASASETANGDASLSEERKAYAAAREAYEREGKKIMVEWLKHGKYAIEKLLSDPKANALLHPPLAADGTRLEGHMNVHLLLKNARKISTLWGLQAETNKLWKTAEYLNSRNIMPCEPVVSLQQETAYNFWKITGDLKDWPACVVGKFFETHNLEEIEDVIQNIIQKDITGEKLAAMTTVEEIESELGLSPRNAEICLSNMKTCLNSVPQVFDWTEN